jgi:hypothetical protein
MLQSLNSNDSQNKDHSQILDEEEETHSLHDGEMT